MRIVLVGLRGTGKSTVGRLIAGRLGWPCVDLDRLIEGRAGLAVAEIFARHGEARFRELEAESLAEVLTQDRTVVATGGGAVLAAANRERLSREPHVVWLRADPVVLAKRLAADPASAALRPALTDLAPEAELARLAVDRAPLYAAVATLAVDAGNSSPSEIRDDILKSWPHLVGE